MKLRIPYLLATVVAVASCLYLADTRSLKAAPLIYVETIAGHEIDLTAPAGKTRLITFWSPDCPISERNVAALKRTTQTVQRRRIRNSRSCHALLGAVGNSFLH